MIGELFRINRDNIVRAAIAEVTKDLTSDAPVEVVACSPENGIDTLILVTGTGTDGDAYEIVFKDDAIAGCLQDDDSRNVAQDLVDQLAAEIRRAVDRRSS